jgi:hypothetical protein
MESINNLFSVINTEDATLIYGGSEFSNWVCEMFGKLCHGLTQENGAFMSFSPLNMVLEQIFIKVIGNLVSI